MIRRILAIVAAFAVLTVAGVTGVVAEQGSQTRDAVKSMQNPCAAKSQPEGAKSEQDPRDAIGAVGKGKSASDLAKDIAAQPTF